MKKKQETSIDLWKSFDRDAQVDKGPGYQAYQELNTAMAGSRRAIERRAGADGERSLSPLASYSRHISESNSHSRHEHTVMHRAQAVAFDGDPSLYIALKINAVTPFEGRYQVNPEGTITDMEAQNSELDEVPAERTGVEIDINTKVREAMIEITDAIATKEHDSKRSVRLKRKMSQVTARLIESGSEGP